MSSQIDLKQLAFERHSPTRGTITPNRSWMMRWGIPLGIVVSFVGITGWSAREQWLPTHSVTVIPVVLSKAEVQAEGTPIFQAAGWIEPRPTAVMCSSMVEGVMEKLLVIEGEAVEIDQPVARMVDADAKIALKEAESTLQLRTAELAANKAIMIAAKKTLEFPAHLEAAHAEAEAALVTLETDLRSLPFLIQAAEARLTLARQDYDGKKALAEAIAGRAVQRAQSELESAKAGLEEQKQREPYLRRHVQALQRKVDALHTRLKLKTDEQRAYDEALANVATAEARIQQAQLNVESANLRLERMTIRSPIRGRVLSLNAQPGRRLMGINAASERDASTVVTLYDPEHLQVRVDVRLEDVPKVQIGQPVQIITAAAKDPLVGTVLAMTSQADIQKNTLQVKVSIENPPSVVRPEMLAQVTFMAPPLTNGELVAEKDPLRLLIPRELIEGAEGSTSIWVVDAIQSVARKQGVTLGRAGTEELVEVTQGVSALDKLIVGGRESLSDGVRVRISGTDRTMGATPVRNASRNSPRSP